LILGWVTVFVHAYHIGFYPSQLSLLSSVGRETNTGQSAVMRCDWGVKAFVDKRVGV